MNKESKLKEDMKNLIRESLAKKLGDDFNVTINEVLKTNVKRDGLTILKKGEYISPTIYLEPYYMRLIQKEDISNILDDIISIYEKAKADNSNTSFDVSLIRDFNQIKNKLFVRLINKHMNKELLAESPFACFLDDFAIVPYCIVNMVEDGIASFRVNNLHLEMWGVESNEIIKIAIANTRALFGVELQSMREVLFGKRTMEEVNLPFPEMFNPPMFVLTNKQKMNGASVALFDDVLKEFAKVHGNFYVIFSSVHEALLIPDDYKLDLESLTSMNLEVNETSVDCDEVLGTKAYFYDEEKGFVIK